MAKSNDGPQYTAERGSYWGSCGEPHADFVKQLELGYFMHWRAAIFSQGHNTVKAVALILGTKPAVSDVAYRLFLFFAWNGYLPSCFGCIKFGQDKVEVPVPLDRYRNIPENDTVSCHP